MCLCFLHRARLWRITLEKYVFSQSSGPRRQIKVVVGRVSMAMTPEHSASSSSLSVKCEFELPEGFSAPEDFDSDQSVFAGEADLPLFVAILLFICLFHVGVLNTNSQSSLFMLEMRKMFKLQWRITNYLSPIMSHVVFFYTRNQFNH